MWPPSTTPNVFNPSPDEAPAKNAFPRLSPEIYARYKATPIEIRALPANLPVTPAALTPLLLPVESLPPQNDSTSSAGTSIAARIQPDAPQNALKREREETLDMGPKRKVAKRSAPRKVQAPKVQAPKKAQAPTPSLSPPSMNTVPSGTPSAANLRRSVRDRRAPQRLDI
ncbi:hypothetical protein FOMPIDRAFT_1056671 [Fomitopsis schrenkii]|uniref:Uncharacterized protein n=1 Tax=Fomitopsis schrenkii TaxID=2126942 RepID=S8DGF5_FOMSC|nr:hypothetical protein FOMPIDRAFT_1056671 [Fomitopsis schrenkii]